MSKIADQVSDAILDDLLRQDPHSRVAVETLTTTGLVMVAGEVTTKAYSDIQGVVRKTLAEIGYDHPEYGLDSKDCAVLTAIHEQSRNIAVGVDSSEKKEQGAGDQGCLRKGTLVRTKNGFRKIEEISIGEEIVTPNGLKKVLDARMTGRKNLVEITLVNGMALECTPDHRILCYDRSGMTYWKAAGELEEGEFACILKPTTHYAEKYASSEVEKKQFFTKYNHKLYGPEAIQMDEGMGYVTGELIGDGWVNSDDRMNISFGTNLIHLPAVKSIVDEKMPHQWREIRTQNNLSLHIDSILIRKHFENFGLAKNKAPQKSTPKSIFNSPQPVIASYLRGLFDSDGTVVIDTGRSKSNTRIRLCSSSLRLLRETQLLLNDFEIKSVIIFNRPKGTFVGKDHRYRSNYDNYVLSIIGFESFQNFALKIGFLDSKKSEKLAAYTKKNPEKKRNSRGIYLIPNRWKKELNDEKSVNVTLPYAVIPVKNVKKTIEDEVYDLEIEDVHLFSGNGIIVHNSVFGFACNETPELMPLPIILAHKLTHRLSEVRQKQILPWVRPDGKSQVTVEYQDGKPVRVDAVVIAVQHNPEVSKAKIVEDIKEHVIKHVCGKYLDDKTRFYINETGIFETGGPEADTGVTGRKIIVDTYGGYARHGGGAFSGKDPSKVDRSASYASRYIAKNVVAAGLAEKCEVQIAYSIGVAKPVSIYVDTSGTGKVSDEKLAEAIEKIFPLKPAEIIKHLDLLRPIYKKTAAYGHFGRNDPDFTWEKTDKVEELKKLV